MPRRKKHFDLKELKVIIKLLRSEGVLELNVDSFSIRLDSAFSPDKPKPPQSVSISGTPKDAKKTQEFVKVKEKQLPPENKDQKKFDEIDELLLSPSSFMKNYENGEFNLDGVIGSET